MKLLPIHKFNGGAGATLCHDCSVIITVGFSQKLYCNLCLMKKDPEIQKAVTTLRKSITLKPLT